MLPFSPPPVPVSFSKFKVLWTGLPTSTTMKVKPAVVRFFPMQHTLQIYTVSPPVCVCAAWGLWSSFFYQFSPRATQLCILQFKAALTAMDHSDGQSCPSSSQTAEWIVCLWTEDAFSSQFFQFLKRRICSMFLSSMCSVTHFTHPFTLLSPMQCFCLFLCVR